jgi:flagellar basal body-associated protein FliL
MARRSGGWWRAGGEARGPRRRAMGCLIWMLVLVVVLLVLALMFGGFQKGSKVGDGHQARPQAQARAQSEPDAVGRTSTGSVMIPASF